MSEPRRMFGDEALRVLLAQYDFATVLDIGAGAGRQAEVLRRAGKTVTTIALAGDVDVVGDYAETEFPEPFDCIWCCHCLEHQRNVGAFLDKMRRDLRPRGVLAVTVPPAKARVVSGHLTLWNAGVLLYNLVLAGFDCREARVGAYGYNVSVIVPHRAVAPSPSPGHLLRDLAPYFPVEIDEQGGFDGHIEALRWEP